MNTITRLSAACLAVAASFLTTPVSAETLKLATVAPDKSVWGAQALRFAAAVEASGADLEIEYFGSAQLGNMADTFKSTLSGRIDIWYGVVPVMSAVTPELGLFTLPFLYDNIDEVKCTVPKMTDKVREAVGAKYHILTLVPVGGQDVSGKIPIRRPSDLQGVKIRSAPVPASMNFFRSMGATPQPLPASETPSALATGLIDAVDFDVTYLTLTGAYKTASNYTPLSFNYNIGAYIISARSWAKLNDAQKTALQAAADSLDFATSVDEVEAFEAAMEAKMLAGGGTKIELTDEEYAEWVAAGRASWDETIASIRGDTTSMMDAIQAARASCN